VLLLVDDDGRIKKMLPVSSGSNKRYKEKGGSGLAYTPRGRFRINSKIAGWRKSPLGLLYYPNYFSGEWLFMEILPFLTNLRVTAAFAFPCPRRSS